MGAVAMCVYADSTGRASWARKAGRDLGGPGHRTVPVGHQPERRCFRSRSCPPRGSGPWPARPPWDLQRGAADGPRVWGRADAGGTVGAGVPGLRRERRRRGTRSRYSAGDNMAARCLLRLGSCSTGETHLVGESQGPLGRERVRAAGCDTWRIRPAGRPRASAEAAGLPGWCCRRMLRLADESFALAAGWTQEFVTKFLGHRRPRHRRRNDTNHRHES